MAKATGPDLNVWEHKGVIGLPSPSVDPRPGALSDQGLALSDALDDDSFTHITEKSFLFNSSKGDPSVPAFECPDVFPLGGKIVVLASIHSPWPFVVNSFGFVTVPGAAPLRNTEGTAHWWVGTISGNDLHFTAESTGRLDYGKPGFSSTYAAKSGANAFAPFTRRVLFGFDGWRSDEMSTGCGHRYILPRDLSLSPTGTQHGGQSVQVGYDFKNKSGFATVPASLGAGVGLRTDRAPLQSALQGDTIELNVFVDGNMIETFFNGEATITTAVNNQVATDLLTSSFINTANLECTVGSWILGLSAPPPAGWKPTYCQNCFTGGNRVVKDVGPNIEVGDCVRECPAYGRLTSATLSRIFHFSTIPVCWDSRVPHLCVVCEDRSFWEPVLHEGSHPKQPRIEASLSDESGRLLPMESSTYLTRLLALHHAWSAPRRDVTVAARVPLECERST
eukprot:gene57378-biopygen111561